MYEFYKKTSNYFINGSSKLCNCSEYKGCFDAVVLKGNIILPLNNESRIDISERERWERRTNEILRHLCRYPRFFSFYVDSGYDLLYENMCLNSSFYCFITVCYYGYKIDYISYNESQDFNLYINGVKEKFEYLAQKTVCLNYEQVGANKLLFHNSAAIVLAHELFGHILEKDNFIFYGYKKYIPLIKSLGIEIIDDPTLNNAPGSYKYDDMRIKSKKTTIIQNNELRALIGGNADDQFISQSLRRQHSENQCLPRMSNLIILSKEEFNMSSNLEPIKIEKLGKCFIEHKTETIRIETELVTVKKGNSLYYVRPFKIMFKIEDVLKKIRAVDGNDGKIRPIMCYKQGQIINCGGLSPDWIIDV